MTSNITSSHLRKITNAVFFAQFTSSVNEQFTLNAAAVDEPDVLFHRRLSSKYMLSTGVLLLTV